MKSVLQWIWRKVKYLSINPFMPRIKKNGAEGMKLHILGQKDVRRTYMKFYLSAQHSSWDIAMGESHGKRLLHRIVSLFLSFYESFLGFFSLYRLALSIGNAKFRITFRCLNMYVSTQKLPQTFLYMSTKCCESFKSFGELRKKNFYSNFYDPENHHLRKIAWIYLLLRSSGLFSAD